MIEYNLTFLRQGVRRILMGRTRVEPWQQEAWHRNRSDEPGQSQVVIAVVEVIRRVCSKRIDA
jgi:hypothetical protein